MKYPRKTIYFKADNVDLYEFLESKGKQASEYICQLIRADLEGETESIEELILKEVQTLREEIKGAKISVLNAPVLEDDEQVDVERSLEVSDIAMDFLMDLK